jgi:anti-sigma factor ChrR (cupin superfamily)
VHAATRPWAPSPTPGVERRMLDRIGDEVARATSIVRYAPQSSFPPHTHGGGEEILVLEGVFQDEHGDFPAGSYLRNPPRSRHTPRSEPGCVIFVKLWQFDPDDRTHVRIDCKKMAALPDPRRHGVEITPLFRDAHEDVRIEIWGPGVTATAGDPGGIELLVVDGSFRAEGEEYNPSSWLRLPPGDTLSATAGPSGARLWVKSGHLREPRPLPGQR